LVPVKEQKRIDKVLEYLFEKYPAPALPVAEPLPDRSAERHAEMIESIVGVKTAIVESTATENERRNRDDSKQTGRHSQMIERIDGVRTLYILGLTPTAADKIKRPLLTETNTTDKFRRSVSVEEREGSLKIYV
jgi:hypothetical protein